MCVYVYGIVNVVHILCFVWYCVLYSYVWYCIVGIILYVYGVVPHYMNMIGSALRSMVLCCVVMCGI